MFSVKYTLSRHHACIKDLPCIAEGTSRHERQPWSAARRTVGAWTSQHPDRDYREGHFLSSKGAATMTAPARRDFASFG